MSTVFPGLIAQTTGACERGDYAEGQRLQDKVNRLREGIKIGPFMAAYKYVARKTGHPLGFMRAPFCDLREAEQAKVDAIMKAEGVY